MAVGEQMGRKEGAHGRARAGAGRGAETALDRPVWPAREGACVSGAPVKTGPAWAAAGPVEVRGRGSDLRKETHALPEKSRQGLRSVSARGNENLVSLPHRRRYRQVARRVSRTRTATGGL